MDVTKIVGIEIDDKKEARELHRAIEHRADEGKIEVEEASLVYKNDRGHITRSHYGSSGFAVGGLVGGIAGTSAFGLAALGIINPIIGVGLLGGITVGAFIGHFFDHHFTGADFLKDIGEGLEHGKGYVLVATDDAGAEFLQGDSLSSGHKMAAIDVDAHFLDDLSKAHQEAAEMQAEEE
jgi:uncharacterized membrane protein